MLDSTAIYKLTSEALYDKIQAHESNNEPLFVGVRKFSSTDTIGDLVNKRAVDDFTLYRFEDITWTPQYLVNYTNPWLYAHEPVDYNISFSSLTDYSYWLSSVYYAYTSGTSIIVDTYDTTSGTLINSQIVVQEGTKPLIVKYVDNSLFLFYLNSANRLKYRFSADGTNWDPLTYGVLQLPPINNYDLSITNNSAGVATLNLVYEDTSNNIYFVFGIVSQTPPMAPVLTVTCVQRIGP